MEHEELAAREAIRDAIARYAHAADTGRFEDLAALFAADGVLEIEGRGAFAGRARILDFLGQVKESRPRDAAGATFIRHHVTSVRIELIAAREAAAKSYFLAITESGPDHWGVYRDRFALIGEKWLFRRRMVKVDGRVRPH
jgi:hypothetical protein